MEIIKNPSFDFMGAILGGAGGAAIGLAASALSGQDLTPPVRAAIMAGGGLALGIAGSALTRSVGAGFAGGGVAIGAALAADHFLESAGNGQTSAIPGYAYRKYGASTRAPRYFNGPGVRAQLNAVQANLGAVVAPVGSALRADLTGLS